MRLWVLLVLSLMACTSNASIQSTSKKLIEYGWNSPTPDTFDPKTLEASVFAGVILKVGVDDTLFGTQAVPTAGFENMQKTLLSKATKKLENSFLAVNVYTKPEWDWFNDVHWAVAEANIRNYARTAKRAGLRGLMFDMEPYSKNPWAYTTQPLASSQSFAAYQQKVRQRGAAFMRAMQAEYPGITILNLYMLSSLSDVLYNNPDQATLQKNLKESSSGLWAAFVNGWLEAADDTVKLIEGNEPSYYYLNGQDFDASIAQIQTDWLPLVDPALRDKYSALTRIGQSIYVDGVMNGHQSPRFVGYYLQNDDERKKLFEHNAYHALRTANEFVWVYGETINWWETPQSLETTMQSALDKNRTGQALGFDTEFITLGQQKYEARISFGGRISKDGKGVRPTRFDPPEIRAACVAYGDEGKYDCTFPKGWSGVVRPVIDGATLEPSERSYTNLSRSSWNESYAVK